MSRSPLSTREVELQIDDGPRMTATLDDKRPARTRSRARSEFAWRFWTLDWGKPAAGAHTIRSRAFDVNGNVPPAPDDPYLASNGGGVVGVCIVASVSRSLAR
jgi:hypothetical protein